MTRDEFLHQLQAEYDKCVEISRAKNSDYAQGDDPFANFRACESLGIDAATGIMVRMSDKFSRVANLLKREAQVQDESIEDTLRDVANYAIILLLLIRETRAPMAYWSNGQDDDVALRRPRPNAWVRPPDVSDDAVYLGSGVVWDPPRGMDR